jgi:hypothetical protein
MLLTSAWRFLNLETPCTDEPQWYLNALLTRSYLPLSNIVCGERIRACQCSGGGRKPIVSNLARDTYRLFGGKLCLEKILLRMISVIIELCQERERNIGYLLLGRFQRIEHIHVFRASWGRCSLAQHTGPFEGNKRGEPYFRLSSLVCICYDLLLHAKSSYFYLFPTQ